MRQATIRFRLISPAYLGGANPQSDLPELRALSFRGLLRYWLRAAAGGAYPDLEHMRSIEEATLGSVKQGSPVSIWPSNKQRPMQPVSMSNFVAAPQFAGEPPPKMYGQRYLFWSMKSPENDEWRKAFPAGTEFDLTLAQRGNSLVANLAFERVLGALWLLVYLGGVGARSRRGAGSLCPLSITLRPALPVKSASLPFAPPTSIRELQKHLQMGIRLVRDLMVTPHAPPSTPPALPSAFDVLAPDLCRIWILSRPQGGVWFNADSALNDLGRSLQAYRRNIKPLEKRAAFGLPIIENEKKNNKHNRRDSSPRSDGPSNLTDRRASPLLLRITPVSPSAASGTSSYVAVATLFNAQFQPTSDQPITPPPDYRLIEQWIETNFPNSMEVQL